MLVLTVNFTGTPGDKNDRLVSQIGRETGAEFLGAGTFLPDARDVEFIVTPDNVETVKAAFIAAGFDDIGTHEEDDEEEGEQ